MKRKHWPVAAYVLTTQVLAGATYATTSSEQIPPMAMLAVPPDLPNAVFPDNSPSESSAIVLSGVTRSDIVTDWNAASVDIIADELKSPLMANRAVALTQTSVYTAVNAISGQYPTSQPEISAPAGASIYAAVAAASHHSLLQLFPDAQARIDDVYRTAISKVPPGQPREDGIAVGRLAAESVFEMRSKDQVGITESYRPITSPGRYVPTVTPVASTWSANRQTWGLTSADQFLPPPPPALDSADWAQDYNEIKAIGAHDSTLRTDDQSEAARFWIATSPRLYFQVVRSVTGQPGRNLTRNARLLAMAGQAVDDALIAVFDAKYHHSFWRPVTAIRNGDIDNNDATVRQENWRPYITTPMHPEYPCAHCIASGAIGNILKSDIGDEPVPLLSATSPTADNVRREWTSVDSFMQEVANARVWEGVHYRFSANAGTEMGRLVAEQIVQKFSAN